MSGRPPKGKRIEDLAEEADLMTIPEVAPYLRLHEVTARRLIREDAFPLPVIKIGSRQLISRYRLREYLLDPQPTEETP